ncbi:MAG: cytochrome P460 family protein [Gemmatimonadota bacterium]
MRRWSVVTVAVGCTVVLGCDAGRQAETPPADTAALGAPATSAVSIDTTAEGLWAGLQQANYTSWPLWPGKEKFYKGQEPHGALLITYVNDLAQDAITNGAAQMPAGAIIVKENYGPDRKLMGATVMEKVPGYDPNNRDWFWAKYTPDGKAEMSGRVDMCYSCHKGAEQYDQLWTLAQDKTGKGPPPMEMPAHSEPPPNR